MSIIGELYAVYPSSTGETLLTSSLHSQREIMTRPDYISDLDQ